MISQIIIISAVAAFAAASNLAVVDVKAPQPYRFGYNIRDEASQQYREEASNGAGVVKGSYGFADARGIQRQVNYVADGLGFRAQVNTNEPGTANQSPAAVQVNSNAPYAGGVVAVATPVVSKVAVPAYLNNGYLNNGYLNNGYLSNGYLNNGYLNNGYLNNGYLNNGYLRNGYLNNGYPGNGFAYYSLGGYGPLYNVNL